MIRGIIFDCFGVLYGGSLELLVSMAPSDRMMEVVDTNKRKDYGYMSYQDYLATIGEIIDRTPQEVDAIMRTRHIRNAELVEFVRQLRGVYKVGMLSNIGETTMDELFPPAEVSELFDAVILSYKEGIAKPHPEVFRLMAERMGLSPGECVMIDDIEENCDGAEVAGMQSIRHVTNDLTRAYLTEILQKST